MSKESSIKVFAENASGTRPANAIPVWIDNISAIGGGGGGGNPEVESYVQTNSATINDVNTSYQTNSANFIPYTASGVELTNSNFKIDTSGQAYKLGSVSGTMPLEFGEVMAGFPDGALTELENGVTYTLTIQGAPDNSMVMFVNLNTQSPYAERPTITNNQCTFTWTHEDASVGILDYYGKINSTSTTLTYTNTTEKRYVLEDELSSGYLQTSGLEYNAVNEISAINGSALAGGSAPSDTFYIYPGKTTDKEISENSGKDLKLYNSANNVFLDFAGKSTLSTYTMFSFKEVTGTQYNQNTVQHLRLRVYPNATSACKVYDTNTVNLLDSNSTVSTAQTAYYDSNGNYLSQTYDNLTALNQFVQSNSANWEGGGGSDVAPLGLWLGYMDSQVKAINNTNVPYSITLRNTNYGQPATVYFQGNYLEWNGTNGNWYIDLVNVLPNLDITDLPYNDSYDTKFTVMEFTNQSTQDKYSANITIDNGDNPYRYLKVYNNTACVVSANGAGASFNVDYIDGQGPHQLSSWTGGFYGVTGAFSNSQATAFNLSVAGYSTAFIGFVEAGSTVASSDVFPPTNNLDPYATYYLGWNANNGGLFWYQPGNN